MDCLSATLFFKWTKQLRLDQAEGKKLEPYSRLLCRLQGPGYLGHYRLSLKVSISRKLGLKMKVGLKPSALIWSVGVPSVSQCPKWLSQDF